MENCQKSKSFSKIWLWKSWNFAIIFWPAVIFFLNKRNVKKLKYQVNNCFLSLCDLYDIEFNFCSFKIWIFPFFINFFPQLSRFWKNGPDKGGGDGDGENFLIGKCCENEMT